MDKKKIWQLLCLALVVWGVVKIVPGLFANLMFLWLNLKANFSPSDAYSVGIIGGRGWPYRHISHRSHLGLLYHSGAGHCGWCVWISQTQKTEVRGEEKPLLIFVLQIL